MEDQDLQRRVEEHQQPPEPEEQGDTEEQNAVWIDEEGRKVTTTINRLKAERRELERLRRDKRRLDWLEKQRGRWTHWHIDLGGQTAIVEPCNGGVYGAVPKLRDAIDAAIAAQRWEGEEDGG